MTQAIELQKLEVKCGTCDFTTETAFEKLHEWHGAKCPKCGDPNLITDDDMKTLNHLIAVADMLNELFPNVDPKQARVTIKTDSQTFKH